jgi:2-methylcitrate dehydratase PrpD
MQLYSFVQSFSYKDAPLHTRELVKTCLLDIIGVAAGARSNQTSMMLKTYATPTTLPTSCPAAFG